MEDLKSEIGRLKNTILSKNRENAMLRTTLKSQQAKLSSLQSLSDSYSTQVRNILSPGQQPYGQIFTPSANEASGSGCDDTSTDTSVSSPLFLPRAVNHPFPQLSLPSADRQHGQSSADLQVRGLSSTFGGKTSSPPQLSQSYLPPLLISPGVSSEVFSLCTAF